MKTRSKALFTYLQQTGVLGGTPEAIALVKKQYRALYKKQWKKQQQSWKEVRISFTIEQYQMITFAAAQCAQKTTVYARTIILSTVENRPFIAERETLLQVLQLLSLAINAAQRNDSSIHKITQLLAHAEQLLLTYLHKYNDERRTTAKF